MRKTVAIEKKSYLQTKCNSFHATSKTESLYWTLSISSVHPFEKKKVKVLVVQSCPILCDSVKHRKYLRIGNWGSERLSSVLTGISAHRNFKVTLLLSFPRLTWTAASPIYRSRDSVYLNYVFRKYSRRQRWGKSRIYQTFLSEGLGLFSGFLILFSIFQNFLQWAYFTLLWFRKHNRHIS